MSKQIERRTFHNVEFRVSAENEPAKITGYGAVFDSRSEDLGWFDELREEIDPHAFDTVLASNPDVRGLFNHDANLVLGRTTAGTLRLSVDARGLSYEIDPPDTQFARDLMVSMRRKDITGSSFAFTCKRDQWTDNGDGSITRRILEFDELFDVSPVTYPAFPAASSGVRSLPESCPVEMRCRLEARVTPPAKQDEHRTDPNSDTGCTCPCEPCATDGDCTQCTHDGCDSTEEGCIGCPMDPGVEADSLSHDKEANANRRMALRVAMNIQ